MSTTKTGVGLSSRDRMRRALDWQSVDRPPLQIHPSPAGLYEHGPKLLDLMRACGHDFGPLDDLAVLVPPKEDFDADGRYHKIAIDDWGTTWEYRIFGIWGHRLKYPIVDWLQAETYAPPPGPERLTGAALENARQAARRHQQRWYLHGGFISLFETLQNLVPYEELLIGLADDEPALHRLADQLVERCAASVANAISCGADAIGVGDDFGTQQGLILSPEIWRRFFAPRYRELFAPAKRAGLKVIFHSCGAIGQLLEDLREVGVDAIWPQLPLFDHCDLARRCRELGLAVQLHPDRGDLMQRGTPDQVRAEVLRLCDIFDISGGGSWLYVEIDPGFAWVNVAALLNVVQELRNT